MKPTLVGMTSLIFGFFGLIAALQRDEEWAFVVIAIVFGVVGIGVLQGLLKRYNAIAKENPAIIAESIEQGLAFMIPFALLAFLADGILGWQSAQAFFAAGLSAVATTSGAVVLKYGGDKWGGFLWPMIWALSGSVLWMTLCNTL